MTQTTSEKELIDLQFKHCFKVLSKLKKNLNAPPFLQPVDPVLLNIPDYPEKIKNPMDISTVNKKLETKEYNEPLEFYDDMKLMFSNCYEYNGEGAQVSIMGKELEKVFDDMWLNLPDKIASKKKLSVGKDQSVAPKTMSRYDEAVSLYEEIKKPKNKRIIWPFLTSVTNEEAPGYSSIIKNPMDLGTIGKKLEANQYPDYESFYEDLKLIVKNCKIYNPKGTDIYRLGLEFEKLFTKNEMSRIEDIRAQISDLNNKLIELQEQVIKDTGRNIYSIKDRERMTSIIYDMSQEECDKVVEIIQRVAPSSIVYIEKDTVEVNFLTLPDNVIEELDNFIKK